MITASLQNQIEFIEAIFNASNTEKNKIYYTFWTILQ